MIHKPRDHKGLLTHSRPRLQVIKKGKKGGSLGGKAAPRGPSPLCCLSTTASAQTGIQGNTVVTRATAQGRQK